MSPAQIEAFAISPSRPAVGRRRPSPGGRRRSVRRGGRGRPEGASPARASSSPATSQPPSVHALAHAMNAGARQRGHDRRATCAPPPPERPAAQTRRSPRSPGRWPEGSVSTLVIVGGNPVFNAPADLEFAKAMQKVGLRIRLGPLQRRDLAPLPLERRRGARPRELERRPLRGRHRHDPAAAHRAALLGQDGARAARGLLGPSRRRPRTTSSRTTGSGQLARRRLRGRVAEGPPRRPRRGAARSRP